MVLHNMLCLPVSFCIRITPVAVYLGILVAIVNLLKTVVSHPHVCITARVQIKLIHSYVTAPPVTLVDDVNTKSMNVLRKMSRVITEERVMI